MNEVPNPARGVIPASTLLLVALTIGGVMLHEQPFKPARPSEHDVEGLETRIESSIDIPQWEDPFKETALVIKEEQQESADGHAVCRLNGNHLSELRSDISKRARADPLAKFRVMLVITASGFSHNSIELRRRQRMALAQAMVEADFSPEAPHHVSYLTFPSMQIVSNRLSVGSSAILMPYEWYTQSNLVLWIQGSDVFTEQSIARLSLETIVNSIIDINLKGRAQVSIIGPGNSDELGKLLVNFSNPEQQQSGSATNDTTAQPIWNFNNWQVYSPRATVDNDTLIRATFASTQHTHELRQQKIRQQKIRQQQIPNLQDSPWGSDLCVGKEENARSQLVGEFQNSIEFHNEAINQLSRGSGFSGIDSGLENRTDEAIQLHVEAIKTLSSNFTLNSSSDGASTPEPVQNPSDTHINIPDNELNTRATELIEIGQFLSSEEILAQIAVNYLDSSPGKDIEGKINRCVSLNTVTEVLSKCLEDLKIGDSDSNWFETVASGINSKQFVVQQSGIYADESSNEVEKAFAAFVLMADAYLDESWQEQWSESHSSVMGLANCKNQSEGSLSSALEAEADLEDSDPDWAATLDRLFFEGYCKPSLEQSSDPDAGDTDERSRDPVVDPAPESLADKTQEPPLASTPEPSSDTVKRFSIDTQKLNRTIANDLAVTRLLAKELITRGLDLCSSKKRIDLVLEGDSIYGKNYKDTFEQIVKELCGLKERKQPFVIIEDHYFFSHAEGEHSAPRGQAMSSSSPGMPVGGVTMFGTDSGSTLELPTGAHQLDYIRRLAKTVSLRKEGISAIGIIGSDVYDKQLIIEALRTYLPGTLIFTTDADALYEHPSFYRFNQNLLVASAYGLTLNDHPIFWTDIEFRDNYQTSFYVAVRAALVSKRIAPSLLPVKLFEVGRSGLIDITPTADWRKPGDVWKKLFSKLLFLLSPILILLVFLVSNRRRVPLETESHKRRYKSLTLLIGLGNVVFVASLAGLLVWAFNASFEPFYIFEGISAAPTVMFRVSAALFAISLIVFIEVRMKFNQRELTRYFGLESSDGASNGKLKSHAAKKHSNGITAWEMKLAGMVSRSHRIKHADWTPPTSIEVWSEYNSLGRLTLRARRVIPLFIGILALIYWIAYGLYEQPHLVRYNTFIDFSSVWGPLNGFQIITFASVFFSSLAVLLAGDALRLCTVFVRWQEYDFVDWPKRPDRSVYENLNSYASNRLASVEIIMRRTEVMRQVIILPFIVLFLQVVARSNLFEGWTWNPGILTIYIGFALYLFYRSSRLQQAANRARKNIIVDLEREASNLRINTARTQSVSKKTQHGSRDQKHLVSTEEVIRHITELKRGLFRPVMDHPLFQAIAWPSTGLGLLALMQLLLT